jgi:hypothetical protein
LTIALNHDVIIEALANHYNIPINCGFTNEIVKLTRRDKEGNKIGELKAETISGEHLESKAMPFFECGMPGINLLKIHGSLDIFTFRDGKDLLRILPKENSVSGVMESLRIANEELLYIQPDFSGRPIKATNEIAYADDDGVMQFLRRSLLSGAFKFDNRYSQVLPLRILDHFKTNIRYLSNLICIGYGFGDIHINQVIREWLERSSEKHIEIVGPGIKNIPSFLLHLAPQVTLKDSTATEYIDARAGIIRNRQDIIEKRLSAYIRCNGIKAQTELQEFMMKHFQRDMSFLAKKLSSLPVCDGDIDINTLKTTPEDLANQLMSELSISAVDILETFLKSKDA